MFLALTTSSSGVDNCCVLGCVSSSDMGFILQTVGRFTVAMGSLLAGASLVHNIYKPDTVQPALMGVAHVVVVEAAAPRWG